MRRGNQPGYEADGEDHEHHQGGGDAAGLGAAPDVVVSVGAADDLVRGKSRARAGFGCPSGGLAQQPGQEFVGAHGLPPSRLGGSSSPGAVSVRPVFARRAASPRETRLLAVPSRAPRVSAISAMLACS